MAVVVHFRSYGRFVWALVRHPAERTFEKHLGGGLVSPEGIASLATGQTCVEKLARLFPKASAVRLPVRVMTVSGGRKRMQEHTVIEFGTSHEVLFASTLPLEFEDRVRVVNSDGSLDARATVVAVRYHNGSKAVAARFLDKVENWIIKP